jgi:hypothetical protein
MVHDLSSLGESVRIEVSKEGIRFASDGKAAQGNILLKQTDVAREQYENYGKEDDDDVLEDEDEDEEMASGENEAEFQAKSEDEKEEPSDDSKNLPPLRHCPCVFLFFVPCERLVTDCTGLESKKEKASHKVHPFAFKPLQLASLVDPKSLETLESMGGVDALLRGLGTRPTHGLSTESGSSPAHLASPDPTLQSFTVTHSSKPLVRLH